MPASVTPNGSIPHGKARPTEFIDVQVGFPLFVLAFTSLTTLAVSWKFGPHLALTLLLFGQLALMACFSTLVIRVKEGALTWQFGPGWIDGRIPISEVVATKIVRSRFSYGGGICRTQRGWQFSPHFSGSIEIHCRDGNRLRLDTGRAHELQQFIQSVRNHRHRLL